MTLALIVAMTDERVIGRNNALPWHISADLKRFKQLTMGHALIMGRKTFESIGRALPGRLNLVLSRQAGFVAPGATVVPTLDAAMKRGAAHSPETFVIGGASLFAEAFSLVDKLYLTMIHHPFPGDVSFPALDLQSEFSILETSEHENPSDPTFRYTYITAVRRPRS